MTGNRPTISQVFLPNLQFPVGHYLEMLKLHLCLYICFSAVFGHVMASQSFSLDSLLYIYDASPLPSLGSLLYIYVAAPRNRLYTMVEAHTSPFYAY